MHTEFWLERWQQNQIGFHCEQINPYLQKYWQDFHLTDGSRVLVPLCGKSNDLLWLASQGYQVMGLELSPLAVEAFVKENNLSATVNKQGKFDISTLDNLQIYCGDFFNLTAMDLLGIRAVYDRAALVALPNDMRIVYAKKLQQLLASGTQILLVAFDYNQSDMQGPPFSVQQAEVEALFGQWCDLTLLCTEAILEQEPNFKMRGLTQLWERVYRLKVK